MTIMRYGVFDPDDLTLELNYTDKVTVDDDGVMTIDLHEIYRILRVSLIDVVYGDYDMIAFVDDEGLLNGSTVRTEGSDLIHGPQLAYAGRMMIAGNDHRGGTLSLTTEQEETLVARGLALGLITAVITPTRPSITVEPVPEEDEDTMFIITIDTRKEGD